MTECRLGVAITTYNRADLVVGLCGAIRLLTEAPCDLVVCDDGSADETPRALRELGETVIGGRNGGVARNKNRGIWYLLTKTKADIILLLDDDVVPNERGWDREWIRGVSNFGHLNFSFPLYRHHIVSGSATADDPALTPMICGCALGFTREALASVGFMDLRFGRYGHEHSDLSFRSLRAGFGGKQSEDGRDLFYVIDGCLTPLEAKSFSSAEDMQRNGELLLELGKDSIYRHAWRNDKERSAFLSEVEPLSA